VKIAYITLGCKVNQYETQAVMRLLEEAGHETVPSGKSGADAVVINTCAVTAESERKSRQAVRRAKSANPGAKIIVCGCSSQNDSAAARALGADFVGGAGERLRIVDYLNGAAAQNDIPAPKTRRTIERLPAGEPEGRIRALLKVQDGCTNFCTYCIIPYLRGPVRSLPCEEAAAEAKRLAEQGAKEIVVTGIELSSYGRDSGSDLGELVATVCKSTVSFGTRIRLSSLEPSMLTPDFAEKLAGLHNLCPHFHLSLQSGSETVLERMNRKYTPEGYAKAVSALRSVFDDPAITTDLIVGFPMESDEEFRETLDFIKSIGFAGMHIFPYSKRSGTKAAEMPGQLTAAEKEGRAAVAAALAEEMKLSYMERQKGRSLRVLVEKKQQSCGLGHTENYMETLVCTTAASGNIERGLLVPVRIIGIEDGRLVGEPE